MILDRYRVAKTPRMSKRMVALFRDPATPVVERESRRWPFNKGKARRGKARRWPFNKRRGKARRFYHIMLKDGAKWAATPYEVRRVWLLVDENGNPAGKGRFGESQRVGWHKTKAEAMKYLDELFAKKISKVV